MDIKRGKIIKYKKCLLLEFDYNISYEFHLPKENLPKILEYINAAKVFDQFTKSNPETERKLNAINLDLNNLINFIEEAINSFYSLKCRYNQKTKSPTSKNSNQSTILSSAENY